MVKARTLFTLGTLAMVNAFSKTPKPTKSPTAQVLNSEPTSDREEKPKPQIFAIMRNAHEVIRGAMTDIQTAVDTEDVAQATEAWGKLMKFQAMHKDMEEGDGTDATPMGFFRILDSKTDKVVTESGLFDLHAALDKVEDSVASAMKEKDIEELKKVVPEFVAANEAHLKKEEDVMMPNLQKLMKAKQPMKKFMCEEILPIVSESPDFEFFVKYANEILEKHDGGMPRARVFDHALWAASTPEQWTTWSAWMKETLSEKTYSELEAVLS